MTSPQQVDYIAQLLKKLGLTGHQLHNVKLGPGVVGRNSSIAWAFELVMLVGVICATIMHSPWLLALSLGGAILVAVVIVVTNVYFGNKNPAAALLEGAEFLEYQQILAAKGRPVIAPTEPVEAPPLLPSQDINKSLLDGETPR